MFYTDKITAGYKLTKTLNAEMCVW